ncbi:DUF3570 domain-containing protein [Pontibacter sp. E15-1]|uniref:DUF3570 domain-containing protein n=1 Tax=Pontibacter sp. E15-1 TaxID=2919918 RepID=UPI001F501099|nr:DUF3570 domain-containing protein [Pontibacter sp. E15-1]MCJ8166779.1 DUF3570 domain-containing protein [Pontibacter sp. E15-1]
MQLRLLVYGMLALAFFLVATAAFGQEGNSAKRVQQLPPSDVNILASYYSQDGNHSPVTGGIGTEELTDFTPTIIVNVPLDTVTNLNVNFGMDYYTSASTDRIDFNVSSASSSDTRTHINVGLSRRNSVRRTIKSITVGGSTEYDYQSLSLGLGWSQESRDGNRELSVGGQVYFDTWKLIYPIELRGQGSLVDTDKRQSYNFSATLSQVISKRLQGSISADLVYQTGLLSTPFHRVYFREQQTVQVEQLPDSRLKYPIGLRLNYYVSDLITMRLFYRFYADSWGLIGNTAEVEVPFKIGPFFSIYPFYRYHTQKAADYFAAFKEHSLSEEFYTSDYDLSNFNSQKLGLGVRYSPLFGIAKFGLPFTSNSTQLKSIDLRAGRYWRSDGLTSMIFSTDFGFTIPSE